MVEVAPSAVVPYAVVLDVTSWLTAALLVVDHHLLPSASYKGALADG